MNAGAPRRDRWLRVGLRWALAVALLIGLSVPHWVIQVDDVYISLAYSHNLADGLGLAWSTGERVEGYSNGLWVAMLAMFAGMGADTGMAAQGLSLFSALAYLGVLSAAAPDRVQGDLVVIGVGAWAGFGYWAMNGLEGIAFGLIVSLGWWATIGGRAVGAPLLAVSTLLRPEGLLHLAVAAIVGRRHKHAIGGSLAILVGYHLIRWAYFGLLIPPPILVKIGRESGGALGLMQLSVDLLTASGLLLVLLIGWQWRSWRGLWVAAPLLLQSIVLFRANGDWMGWSRLVMPGMMATALAAMHLPNRRLHPAIALVVGLPLLWSSTKAPAVIGGQTVLAERELPNRREVRRALRGGLHPTLTGDLVWMVMNLPDGATVMSGDVGLLAHEASVKVIDLAGLNEPSLARILDRDARMREVASRLRGGPGAPDCLRVSTWDGSFPEVNERLKEVFPYVHRFRYGGLRAAFVCQMPMERDAARAERRWAALAHRFPRQPWFAWRQALAIAEQDRTPEALALFSARHQAWPFGDHPLDPTVALSFVRGHNPLHTVEGKGFAMTWNDTLTSRPLRRAEWSTLRLRVMPEHPGEEGAHVTVRWSDGCGEALELWLVETTMVMPIRDCATPGSLEVAFLNDAVTEDGDRNVYVSLDAIH